MGDEVPPVDDVEEEPIEDVEDTPEIEDEPEVTNPLDESLSDIVSGLSEEDKVSMLMKLGDSFDYDETKRTLPFPNEHACRLKSPNGFDMFRRTSRESEGKRYDIIWGIKDDTAVEQAYRYPKSIWDSADARKHCTAHKGKSFEPAKSNNSIIWENVDVKDSPALSQEAIDNSDVPPKGVSGIPEEMMKTIPARLSWWEQDCPELRVAMRNEYVKMSRIAAVVVEDYGESKYLIKCEKGFYFLAEFAEGFNPVDDTFVMSDPTKLIEADIPDTTTFVLMHHYWKGRVSVQHYDLFIGDKEQFVCVNNLLKENTNAIKRLPYSKGFSSLGRTKEAYLKAGSPGNPSHMASWARTIDEGEVIVLESRPMYRRLRMKGKTFDTIIEMKCNDKKVWTIGHMRELSEARPSVIRMELQCNAAYFEGDDLIVPGFALSYGVWNGEFYSKDVVLDRPERIVGIPVAVGTHFTEKNVGHVRSYNVIEEAIHIEAVIKGEFKLEQQRVLDGEFVGWSVEVDVIHNPMRRMIEKIKKYFRIVAVDIPACTVCTLDGVCT